MKETPKPFEVRMMYKSELAAAYQISRPTLNKLIETTRNYLKKIHGEDMLGEFSGKRFLTSKQIKLIVEHNGPPYE